MRLQEELFEALSKSRFRSRFKLGEKERVCLMRKGNRICRFGHIYLAVKTVEL
jgi:hypothetical protein